MRKRIRITESELTKIVKRVISESHEESSLYKELRSVLRNSNYPPESRVEILRMMADEIESGMSQRKETQSRWDKENERARRNGGLDPNNEF
jgi:hypothetical protein